jgi:hypothetical protein
MLHIENMNSKLVLLLALCIVALRLDAQQPPWNNFNIAWTTQSNNSSESMPCGGGDIGMNVWVEKGELLIYVARSGSFDEDNALLKTGRLRIRFSPNPFDGSVFRQELHLKEGYVSLEGENNGLKATVKVWTEVLNPIVRIEINSNKKISAEAGYENWRYHDRVLQARENFGNSWKWAAPKNNVREKDSITFKDGGVLFYHHNQQHTIFDATVKQQKMDAVKDQLYNPLARLAFGGYFSGKNFIPAGTYDGVYVDTDFRGWKLKSKSSSKTHSLVMCLHTAQTDNIAQWKTSLDSVQRIANTQKAISLFKTAQWWRQFWDRSFVAIDKNNQSSKAWEIGHNYQLFRYMLACNALGTWPTKFNGGLLTVDPVFTDKNNKLTPDYRNWGGGLHTMQNQRLVYFPMIKNGDWDMLQAQLEFYFRILKNAELRTRIYWKHGGACFTEQMENYGLPDYAEYGTDRPADYNPGVEYNAWLEYTWDTVFEFCLMMLDEQRYTGADAGRAIPFIESCLQFFDEHYQYLAKQRGRKALDGNGKLVLYPGSAAETYKMANNASSTIAALQTIVQRLLQLPSQYATAERKIKWEELLKRIPPLNFSSINGHPVISPAKTWERVNNEESVSLYPVFPWGIYSVGKPGLDTAINTWKYDPDAIKFRSHVGWKQDNIWAARLGLADDAWQLITRKLGNSERRFPAFWGPGFDWVPDHNWGGSGMIGLQEMLMQVDDKRILLFPAWKSQNDVHFKLHAPYNTTVEAELKGGKLVMLKVLPEERKKDVEVLLQ